MALTDNLIAFWELEEASGTRNDAHGSNHLTDNNTVAQGTGKVGNCADFELDNSEYLSIADNAALSVGDEDFTIQAWFNIEANPGFRQGIVGKSSGGADGYWLKWEPSYVAGQHRVVWYLGVVRMRRLMRRRCLWGRGIT